MKFLLAALPFLLFISCRKNDKQITQTNFNLDTTSIKVNINQGLQSIFFESEDEGYIGGSSGGIYKTIDGAKTWQQMQTTVTYPVRSIFFVNQKTGFVAGGDKSCGGTGCTVPGGFILKTSDAGSTWKKIYTPADNIELSSIYFTSNTTGYCAGANEIFKTINGGETWSQYTITNLGSTIMQLYFVSNTEGYAACLFNKILKTTDAGATWQIVNTQTNVGYYALVGTINEFYAAGQGKIIKSVDKGNTWNVLQNSPSDMYALYFINPDEGFAFGRGNYSGGDFGFNYGAIYSTKDGGKTWTGSKDLKSMFAITAVSFPNTKTGYAISGNKIIRLKTK